MNLIEMQYPFDASGRNELYDGEIHPIVPQEIFPVKLNGKLYYVMNYIDYKFPEGMMLSTLMMLIDGVLTKVPLDNYNYLFSLMKHYKLPSIDVNAVRFPEVIGITQTLKAEDIFLEPEKEDKKNVDALKFDEYIVVNRDGETNVTGSVFSPGGIIVNPDDTEEYIFNKAPNFSLKDEEIRNGINGYFTEEDGTKIYNFTIDVPEGVKGSILVRDSDGNVKELIVTIVPGVHEYHVVYDDFCVEDYEKAQKSEKMVVHTTWPEYRDRLGTAKAFRDAGEVLLDTKYLDANGNTIGGMERR